MERKLEYTVTAQDVPGSVETILRKRLGLSKHQISSAKYRPGGICLGDRQVRVTEKISQGDRIQVLLEEEEIGSGPVEAVWGQVEILYEDDDLAAVNKPPGVALHPAHGHWRDTLANYLQYYYESRNQQVKIRAIGRLDRDTSGVVLFGKNQVAAARLWGATGRAGQNSGADPRSLAARPVTKEYWALARGRLEQKQGRIELPIRKKPGALNEMEVCAQGSTMGRPAITNYQVMEEYKDASLVRLCLETGRTHQIRVHMAALGHPLLGDPIYGADIYREGVYREGVYREGVYREGIYEDSSHGEDHLRIGRAALHCRGAEVIHPFTGERLKIEAPLPEDMEKLLRWLRADW